MLWNKDALVAVQFTDLATGKVFAKAALDPGQLPDSFEAETTMEISGKSWMVIRAEPMTRAGYTATRKLQLFLQPITVEHIQPGELYYSLPTLCDAIPGVIEGSTKTDKRVLEIHEDDWRQVELVTRAQQAAVEADLAKIREIYEHKRTTSGAFETLHVRQAVPEPLGQALTMQTLREAFPPKQDLEGLAYRGVAGVIEDAFAYETEGAFLYGQVRDGQVLACCFLKADGVPTVPADFLLVDWVRATVR